MQQGFLYGYARILVGVERNVKWQCLDSRTREYPVATRPPEEPPQGALSVYMLGGC